VRVLALRPESVTIGCQSGCHHRLVPLQVQASLPAPTRLSKSAQRGPAPSADHHRGGTLVAIAAESGQSRSNLTSALGQEFVPPAGVLLSTQLRVLRGVSRATITCWLMSKRSAAAPESPTPTLHRGRSTSLSCIRPAALREHEPALSSLDGLGAGDQRGHRRTLAAHSLDTHWYRRGQAYP